MTKAKTLEFLAGCLKNSIVDDFIYFTVAEWEKDNSLILRNIKKKNFEKIVIARSSSLIEDSNTYTHAGAFKSLLDIPLESIDKLKGAIEEVIYSFYSKNDYNPLNQIMVQNQLLDPKLSGVVFTRHPKNYAPYYIIEYDDSSGMTNLVTGSGRRKYFCSSHFIKKLKHLPFWNNILDAIKEIEEVIPAKLLNVEFAVDKKGFIHIFQVRKINGNEESQKKKLVDSELKNVIMRTAKYYSQKSQSAQNFYSDMSDWNPAEMLGARPSILATSIYRFLITRKTWAEARTALGYSNHFSKELMIVMAGKPYIDVEASLRSLLPPSLPANIKDRLIQYQVSKLIKNPYLHDKIEFQIAYSCADLSSPKRTQELLENGFSQDEVVSIENALLALTVKLLKNIPACVEECQLLLMKLTKKTIGFKLPINNDRTGLIKRYLEYCRDYGIFPFAKLARLAFVGNYLLNQMVDIQVISRKDYEGFFSSINTIPTVMAEDRLSLKKGLITERAFLEKYGHLRPGTYNITSPRYDQTPGIILDGDIADVKDSPSRKPFSFNKETLKNIQTTLYHSNIDIDADFFLMVIKEAIEWREKAKFEFTRTLSNIIEFIAEMGKNFGLSRSEIAYMDIKDFISPKASTKEGIFPIEKIGANKIKKQLMDCILLPSVLSSKNDFFYFNSLESKPNFITNKSVEASLVQISDSFSTSIPELKNKIVVAEAADPGYDWIFLKGIAGLVTKYGGVGSHMAIRCHELNIPAAIGCGDVLFEEIKKAERILINAAEEKISFIK